MWAQADELEFVPYSIERYENIYSELDVLYTRIRTLEDKRREDANGFV